VLGAEWSALVKASFSRVRVSELMAKNETGASDEMAEIEDWIELGNGSTQSVDLSGWFLSDDPLDPMAWEIPAGTILAPGDELLIWADDDVSDGPYHASFQLSAVGEGVYLSAPVGSGVELVDSVSFGAQLADQSLGRMPSQGDVFVRIMDPSPNAQNTPGPGEAIRFAYVEAPVTDPMITVTSLPFAGQVVPLFLQGFAPGSTGLLQVGSSINTGGELIGERLGGVEQAFQVGLLGSVNLNVLLPRRSSRLQPASVIPPVSVFYLQAVGRSGVSHGVAIGVQN
jgi:hypothetical protein